MAAAFSAKDFDASNYTASRPRYSAAFFDAIYAFHEGADLAPADRPATPRFDALLDIGVGSGQLAFPLAARFKHVYGIDPSEVMLDKARRCDPGREHGASARPPGHTIEFRRGSAENTGLPDQSVDAIVAGVAAHWFAWTAGQNGHPSAIWQEFERILRPGGTVTFIGYNLASIKQMPAFNEGLGQLLSEEGSDRLAAFYDRSKPDSPMSIIQSFYDPIPRPSGPMWHTDSTQLYKIDVEQSVYPNTALDPAQIDPPPWFRDALGVPATGKPTNVMYAKGPVLLQIVFLRSTSGYTKYLNAHPEEAKKVATNEDVMVRWLDESRMKQVRRDAAAALQKDEDQLTQEEVEEYDIPWTREVEHVYPLVFFFARRSDKVPT